MLARCGVPVANENKVELLRAFTEDDQRTIAEWKDAGRCVPVNIWMLGAFDTVKARPGSDFGVKRLPDGVRCACHAMAIDEWRENFDVLGFDDGQSVDQRWFAGGHSDIGGGYGDPSATDDKTRSERLASDVVLDWMVGRAQENGLILSSAVQPFVLDRELKPVFHDARTWYYRLWNVLSKFTSRFLRIVPNTAVVDDTVAFWQQKFGLSHDNYDCTASSSSMGSDPMETKC